jgi:hypothetical protein
VFRAAAAAGAAEKGLEWWSVLQKGDRHYCASGNLALPAEAEPNPCTQIAWKWTIAALAGVSFLQLAEAQHCALMDVRRMNEDNQPANVTRPVAEIERFSATLTLSRTVTMAAMSVLVVAGLALVAVAVGSLGFDPAAVSAIAAAILIGVAFMAWHRHKMHLYANLLRSIETQQVPPDRRDPPWGENR